MIRCSSQSAGLGLYFLMRLACKFIRLAVNSFPLAFAHFRRTLLFLFGASIRAASLSLFLRRTRPPPQAPVDIRRPACWRGVRGAGSLRSLLSHAATADVLRLSFDEYLYWLTSLSSMLETPSLPGGSGQPAQRRLYRLTLLRLLLLRRTFIPADQSTAFLDTHAIIS